MMPSGTIANMILQSHAKLVLSLLGSAVLALIVAFVLASISVSGVISMKTADIFLWIAAIIFWIAILAGAIVYCPNLSGAKSGIVVTLLLLISYGGFVERSHLASWLFQKKAEQEAREHPAVNPLSQTRPQTQERPKNTPPVRFPTKANVVPPNGAGIPKNPNQQKCETGSICNQASVVNSSQTINNYGPPQPQITVNSKCSAQADERGDFQCDVTIHTDIEMDSNIAFNLVFNKKIENYEINSSEGKLVLLQGLDGYEAHDQSGNVIFPGDSNDLRFSVIFPTSLPKNAEIYATVKSKSPMRLIAWKRGY